MLLVGAVQRRRVAAAVAAVVALVAVGTQALDASSRLHGTRPFEKVVEVGTHHVVETLMAGTIELATSVFR